MTGAVAVIFLIVAVSFLFFDVIGKARGAAKEKKRRAERNDAWQKRGET
jgi:hypothetical protein